MSMFEVQRLNVLVCARVKRKGNRGNVLCIIKVLRFYDIGNSKRMSVLSGWPKRTFYCQQNGGRKSK